MRVDQGKVEGTSPAEAPHGSLALVLVLPAPLHVTASRGHCVSSCCCCGGPVSSSPLCLSAFSRVAASEGREPGWGLTTGPT